MTLANDTFVGVLEVVVPRSELFNVSFVDAVLNHHTFIFFVFNWRIGSGIKVAYANDCMPLRALRISWIWIAIVSSTVTKVKETSLLHLSLNLNESVMYHVPLLVSSISVLVMSLQVTVDEQKSQVMQSETD